MRYLCAGCNLYCLDRNYGGVLIVWDKLFGTFMEEKREDEIIYGLVVSPQSFNPLYLQVRPLRSRASLRVTVPQAIRGRSTRSLCYIK